MHAPWIKTFSHPPRAMQLTAWVHHGGELKAFYYMKKEIAGNKRKEMGVFIPANLIGSDRRYIIIGNDGMFITFRKVLEHVPFYYARTQDCQGAEWIEQMREKRWFTREVEDTVNALL